MQDFSLGVHACKKKKEKNIFFKKSYALVCYNTALNPTVFNLSNLLIVNEQR